MKLIIIEDDPLIAFDTKEMIEAENYTVSGIYYDPEEVLAAELDYDLALIDINLSASMDGIGLAKQLKAKTGKPHIFITSYFDSKTVVMAGGTNPVAYIVKPFEQKDLLANLLLVRAKMNVAPLPTADKKLFIKSSKTLHKVDPLAVDFLQAYDVYTKVMAPEGNIVASKTLKEIEPAFRPYGFIRVHKSYVVNLEKIQTIQDDVIFIGEHQIPLGRTYKKEVLERFSIL